MAPSIELPVFIAALQRGSRALARQAHLLKTDGLMNLLYVHIFWRDLCKGGPAGVVLAGSSEDEKYLICLVFWAARNNCSC